MALLIAVPIDLNCAVMPVAEFASEDVAGCAGVEAVPPNQLRGELSEVQPVELTVQANANSNACDDDILVSF
ncbi:MAG: hypothetical protein KF752_09980 [Pirellulaceae bacterium]|nr:hypothetical protein [Pirellulaceae bacterium]